MTKDRRLGRGLAALLGTPLEEDGIVDGVTVARSDDSSPSATRSSASVPHSSGLKLHQSDDSPRSGVTGSVPLGARSPSKRLSDSDAVTNAPVANAPVTNAPVANVPVANVPVANAPVANAPVANSKKRSSDDKASAETRHVQSLELNVSDIDNNPFQPRRRFNEVEIASLAESIREHEQLQPILVRSVGGRYQLISGERRLRATIHAGLTTIRAEIREADDRLVAELAIVENLQRKDLDAIEKAMSFRRYIDEHECTQEDLAKRLKIDRSTIANLMRLLELPELLQTWVQNEKITAGHARTLLPLGDESQQLEFARQIIEESWTVRETERRVAAHLLEEDALNPSAKADRSGPRSGPRKRGTPHLASLEQQLRLSLGTKTEIRQHNNGKGKIVISFSNPAEFERLFALVCPQIAQKAA